MHIDWQSDESHLILNPRLPFGEASFGKSSLHLSKEYTAHIWLHTSGSVQTKLVALHKQAFLASAQAVNKHLQATSCDIWINPLPLFHVGGLGILARGHLNGAHVYTYPDKWSPHSFQKMVADKRGTLTSLVPTQVYDLVVHNLAAPKSLRAVIVGGGACHRSLYERARKLGWPLLPSYGMTECASQVATAPLESLLKDKIPDLEILSHIDVKIEKNHQISICSSALLTAYANIENGKICLSYPVVNGWFLSQDRGCVTGRSLTLHGRLGDFIKISGESVEFGHLEKILEEIKLRQGILFDIALGAIPDLRLGHVIHLFSTHEQTESIKYEYNSKVMPYERIRKVHVIPAIPRSALNKVLKTELIKIAGISS